MRVAITGAAGTIGGALLRHYVNSGDTVYAIDTNENGLYQLRYMPVVPVLQDIAGSNFWHSFYDRNSIDLVINCAAAKQLPIVEAHPFYAYRSNADAVDAICDHEDRPPVVHISTDKAVYPVSLYGFTKYIGEEKAKYYGCRIVRLVNVIDSSGSVFEVFRGQIESGGPVTLTDPHMSRYFMALDQAVKDIVTVASTEPGLYMPVNYDRQPIYDIAKDLIGDKDIKIQVTGIRPGEKIKEDLIYQDEVRNPYTPEIDRIKSPAKIILWGTFEEEKEKALEYGKYNFQRFMWRWVPEKC